MILCKINTDIFGKTVPDDTPKQHIGGELFLIRGRVYCKSTSIGMRMFLDGVQVENITEYYILESKSALKNSWDQNEKKAAALVNYNVSKISVNDL
jgi:hypothetical protein